MNSTHTTPEASAEEMNLDAVDATEVETTGSAAPRSPIEDGNAGEESRASGASPGDGSGLSPEDLYSDSTLSALGPLSPYDDEPSTLSALPAPRLEDSIQVWEPTAASPTAWRKGAFSHAGTAVLGAMVGVGAFIAFGPKQIVRIKEPGSSIAMTPPATDPGTIPGLTPGMTPGMVPGPTAGGNVPVPPLQMGGNPAATGLPPGVTLPNASKNPMPNTQPGTGVPVPPAPGGSPSGPIGGGSIPPMPANAPHLPPLTGPPPMIQNAKGLPPLSPGFSSMNSGVRPPLNMGQTSPLTSPNSAAQPGTNAKAKGPMAPLVRAGSNGNGVVPVAPPATRSNDNDDDTDGAIARLKRTAETNPKDAATQLQLEKMYRKKLIQAERVDEMEQYRSLADDARDKAKSILNSDKTTAPKPAAPKPAASDGGNEPKPDAAKPTDKPADKPDAPPADGGSAKPANPS